MRLRPVRRADLALLERFASDPVAVGEFNWFGPGDPAELRRRFDENAFVGEQQGRLIVALADGQVAGEVTWHVVFHGPSVDCGCWNIGISLLPECRGRGVGSAAQRLLADRLFATTPAGRVEAGTDVDNLPEQRALTKAGFRREGVLRSAQFRGGRWRDVVLFSRLRGE